MGWWFHVVANPRYRVLAAAYPYLAKRVLLDTELRSSRAGCRWIRGHTGAAAAGGSGRKFFMGQIHGKSRKNLSKIIVNRDESGLIIQFNHPLITMKTIINHDESWWMGNRWSTMVNHKSWLGGSHRPKNGDHVSWSMLKYAEINVSLGFLGLGVHFWFCLEQVWTIQRNFHGRRFIILCQGFCGGWFRLLGHPVPTKSDTIEVRAATLSSCIWCFVPKNAGRTLNIHWF